MSDTIADLQAVLSKAGELARALGLLPESALIAEVLARLARVDIQATTVRRVERRRKGTDHGRT